MWTPSLVPSAGAATVTEAPVVQAPPSRLYSVCCTPQPASVAAKTTVTGVLCQVRSAPDWVVLGAVVSIFTVQLLVVSTLPAPSVERYWTVCTPSLLPSAGAATVTEVPVVQAPPSRLCSVVATPLEASLAVKFTVTGVLCQAASAPVCVVIGAVASILTVQEPVALTLPAASMAWYSNCRGPSPEPLAGAGTTKVLPAVSSQVYAPCARYCVSATPEPP